MQKSQGIGDALLPKACRWRGKQPPLLNKAFTKPQPLISTHSSVHSLTSAHGLTSMSKKTMAMTPMVLRLAFALPCTASSTSRALCLSTASPFSSRNRRS